MNERVRIFKGHGLGNDYLAMRGEELNGIDPGRAARILCDRHRGIGSDGLLLQVPSEEADVGLRIINPDGSEAEKSGNGLRIFAVFLLRAGWCDERARFTVETPGGTVRMTLEGEHPAGGLAVRVEMGRVTFGPSAAGVVDGGTGDDDLTVGVDAGTQVLGTPLSIGNPHFVVFRNELDIEELRTIGPTLSTHPRFSFGVNVQLARIRSEREVEALVWERGAGETEASGSSACAVAAAAVRAGFVDAGPVRVRMPGGTLEVEVADDWSLVLAGPAEDIAWLHPTPSLLRRLRNT